MNLAGALTIFFTILQDVQPVKTKMEGQHYSINTHPLHFRSNRNINRIHIKKHYFMGWIQ